MQADSAQYKYALTLKQNMMLLSMFDILCMFVSGLHWMHSTMCFTFIKLKCLTLNSSILKISVVSALHSTPTVY